MLYKAIIFDLDGTAVLAAKVARPSDELCAVARQYAASANLSVATGRSWEFAKPVIDALGIVRPCIVSGGASIIDPRAERILWEAAIKPDIANQIITVARDYPYKVYCSQGLKTLVYESVKTVEITDVLNAMYIVDVSDEHVQEITDRLQRIPGTNVARAGSWVPGATNFDITDKNATKEHAVTQLCAILTVPPQEVAGVGDGFNDMHLFNAVGHKVAMGNAVPELKATADEVIDTVDNNGLSKFILSAVSS